MKIFLHGTGTKWNLNLTLAKTVFPHNYFRNNCMFNSKRKIPAIEKEEK